jgi:hypothetical protein
MFGFQHKKEEVEVLDSFLSLLNKYEGKNPILSFVKYPILNFV